MIIQHNMAAVKAMTQLGITNTNLKKSAERLSSGYRINRAADDAAVLAISEKKRAQIRGLRRAAKNAEDGISLVQTGDGAMSQIEDLLQRMRELTVQALNDAVYEPEDQAALQMEFNELQNEIDRVNDQTEFNKKPVFEHYSNTYYMFEGNRVWSQDQMHKIDSSNQSLTVKYVMGEGEPEKEITLSIPEGEYTTQQLIDEMDDLVTALGDMADGFYLEYTDINTCNLVLQGGEQISEITGGLSYLFFDEHKGSKVGSLIGTTVFDPNFALEVNDSNNELKFTIEYFDGTKKDVDFNIDNGYYTRSDMIDYLNGKLAGTGMTASEYGEYSIQVGGEDGIITGLKGNMFKIDDEGERIMISVFYDNTKYGNVKRTPAVFTGGAVLVNTASDTECNKFNITDSNNTLWIRVGEDKDAPYEEITLDNKSYSMNEMVNELNKKFAEKQINVTASSYGPTRSNSASPNGNWYYFSGIKLTSSDTGRDVEIEFDEQASTAYETLFVKRTYTDAGKPMQSVSGRDDYTSPKLTGGKIFGTDNIPLTVVGGDNDSFSLQVTETESGKETTGKYTITLTSGKTYNTIDEILTEINTQLNSANAPVGIKGKIQAIQSGGAIRFVAANDNRTVTLIQFAETSSKGYQDLFVGKKTEYSTTAISSSGTPPTISLDNLTDPVTIDSANDRLAVKVGNEDRVVSIPHGKYTPQEFADVLTELLKGKENTVSKNYIGTGAGETTSTTESYSGTGRDNTPYTISCNAHGTGGAQDGTTTVLGGTAATYTVPVALGNPTVVDSSNNQFSITVNGRQYNDIRLDEKSYTPSELATQFQEKLNAAIQSSADKVNVTLQGGKLVFTTNLKGSGMSMSFDTGSSSFMKSLSKNQSAASVTTKSLQSAIKIDGTNNIYTMSVNGNSYTVTLDNGNYSPSSFATMLQGKLRGEGAGIDVTATSVNALRFVTDAKGDGASIDMDTGNCGTAASAMFGDQVSKTAASAKLDTPLLSANSNTVKQSEEGKFTVQLTQGGTVKAVEVTIPSQEGGYTNVALKNKINETLAAEGMGVTASVDSEGYLTFTTSGRGGDVSLDVTGNMKSVTKTPDVEASVDPDTGKLVLKNKSNGATISVTPGMGSAILQPIPIPTTYAPSTPTVGSILQRYYTLNTNSLFNIPESTTIKDYNKEFTFTYIDPNGTKDVTIELDEKDYSHEELKKALQEKLDNELGEGELKVDVSASAITIQAGHYGRDYYISNMKGGFYQYVLEGNAIRGSDEETKELPGKQNVSDAYIVGRKDVRNNISKIQQGVNDVLSIDVTVNGKIHSFNMTLDPGNYDANALTDQLQKKIDEQLQAAGYPELPEHSILAGVGVFDSGVAGADDKNALFFYLNPDVELVNGEYRIDGLGGTALFEIFYKTEGDLVPAYLTGTKDISDGIEILPDENEFAIDVDGTTYQYTIPEGEYTCEEFLQKLNEVFDDPNAFLTASMSGNALKISYEKMGEHEISNVQGPAKNVMFYETYGRKDYEPDLYLQIGANAGQGINLQRFSMSTLSMGINSIVINGHKYADKALGRLDAALNYLNSARSIYGANQNRLEYTIKGNEITAENTQASESRDRDTNMAEEMMLHAKSRILQQTGTAVLAQANQHTQAVLGLLPVR